jgi:hypothetical protein
MTSGPLRRRDLVAMLGAVIVAAPAVLAPDGLFFQAREAISRSWRRGR